jgi:predicted butyrate kinase (DUF1464 family)
VWPGVLEQKEQANGGGKMAKGIGGGEQSRLVEVLELAPPSKTGPPNTPL